MTLALNPFGSPSILFGTMAVVGRPGTSPPRHRTFLEFVETDQPTPDDVDFARLLLEARREPSDDPIFRSLENLLDELSEERPRAPPPIDYDRVDQKIILCTFDRSFSPAQITKATGIPIAKVYRRIRKLERQGLLKHVRTVMVTTPKKKLVKLYRTNLKKVRLMVGEGDLRLGIKFRRVAPRPSKISILVDALEARARPS